MLWTILGGIGGIATVITVIFALLTYRQQLRRKELTYQVVSDAPLAVVNPTVKDLQILLNGRPAENMRQLVVKVWNSGNAALTAEDYFDPLSFEFEEGEIISSEIQETNPKRLIDKKSRNTFLQLESHSISFPKFAFNPSDTVQFTILLSGNSELAPKGRIKEGKIIEFNPNENIKRLESRRGCFSTLAALALIIGLVPIIYAIFTGHTLNKLPDIFTQLVIWGTFMCYIFFLPVIYYYIKIVLEKRRIPKSSWSSKKVS